MGEFLHHNFRTIKEIERQLLFIETVPDYSPYVEGYTIRSEVARSKYL